jgi:hypothetical protein
MARTTVPGVFRTLQRWLIGIFTYSFVGSAVLRGTTLPGQVSHQQLRSRLVDHRHWTRVGHTTRAQLLFRSKAWQRVETMDELDLEGDVSVVCAALYRKRNSR